MSWRNHPDFALCRAHIRTWDDLVGKVFSTAGPYGWKRVTRVEVIAGTMWVTFQTRTPKGRWTKTWCAPFSPDAAGIEGAFEYFLRGNYIRQLNVDASDLVSVQVTRADA